MNQRSKTIAKQIAGPVVAALLFVAVVWRQWPLSASTDDIGAIVYALVGLALVLSPDTLLSFWPISSHRQFSAREAALFGEDDVIRVIGLVVLFDALTGWGKWLVWTWW